MVNLVMGFARKSIRWPFWQDDIIEVWDGLTLLAELPGDLIYQLIGHYLMTAKLTKQILTLTKPVPRLPTPRLPRALVTPKRPPKHKR